MATLKQELGLVQGVGMLSTSLLGTGVFAVPALAAQVAGDDSLWAWPLLIVLVFPIAIGFAALGRHFPSAGGAAHFVGKAFGPHMARVTGWLFLSVIPVGLPASLQIAAGFWQALFGWQGAPLLAVELITLLAVWLLGTRGAGSSANLQTLIALLVVLLIAAVWWRGGISPTQIPWPAPSQLSLSPLTGALAVMFWCFVGLEAFAHLASEFRHPQRDFPRALLLGLLLAGAVYWACSVAVLHFHAFGDGRAAAASLPGIVVQLFGRHALWIACVIGYLACFASLNVYIQSFARLVWSQAQRRPQSRLAQLSARQAPVNALTSVMLCCLLCSLLIYLSGLSLDALIVYANGVFIMIYLLCMLAGCRLLRGHARLMALTGSVLCLLLLAMVGVKSLYALGMLLVLYLLLPRRAASHGG
ncbi:L-methionine/branched-chain amino acid transporter [Edwardsiella piscicida]|uniref:L-methionine/branched-chain amino acid transporter n=1 Tax=Edwardsiella piscicida TaxID=1263550 RepID=UPI00084C0092|nr:L-methionine/branched-chain amino acid transporter [Edwardsiella piscicida]EKS7766718.1 L-methionine/branched-chain amino acid transporter [Edwardsiella piscicida]EKS7792565.1 L-methionine/branched-chain amino acid transporter [Edwardsiella piscicida]EKS7813593.1 L-methionine/branched-chain amino acid transporter [Edwardsiella piscicida]ELM3722169.1 L-methionine/branched-chain amino acid transporter [Edwardsiella piscicida]ELM3727280.1 L-methionine/branched-chain amino acid transporter [Edw